VPTNIFDTTVTGKILKEDFDFTYWNYIWTEEFGKLSKKNMQGVIEYLLRACVINGIVYGDTNFTALSVNTSEPVFNYKLFNNYPNPFNPKTSIQYAVGSWQFVILKVYDVLGNEIFLSVKSLPRRRRGRQFYRDKKNGTNQIKNNTL